MSLLLVRVLWVAAGAICGYFLSGHLSGDPEAQLRGTALGGGIAIGAVFLERILERYPPSALIGGALGLFSGVVLGSFIGSTFAAHLASGSTEVAAWRLGSIGFLGSLGWVVGLRKGLQWRSWSKLKGLGSPWASHGGPYLLMDTSVIIDGRIADVCASGFLTGPLAIPRFVLRELQKIADSQDPLKKARGRRGLDVLRTLREQIGVEVKILDEEPSSGGDVDSRLVELAKEKGCALLTNDLNMHKVAEVQGVKVLNINHLAHALRPVVLPGEELKVRIIKEGREEGQGVGYMEDGTMVVVDNGRKFLGRTVEAVVTSVIQTSAGRMIFTSLKEDQDTQIQNVRG